MAKRKIQFTCKNSACKVFDKPVLYDLNGNVLLVNHCPECGQEIPAGNVVLPADIVRKKVASNVEVRYDRAQIRKIEEGIAAIPKAIKKATTTGKKKGFISIDFSTKKK